MIWQNNLRYYDEASGEMKITKVGCGNFRKFTSYWTPFLSDFIEHLDSKGWFDKVYIAFDERHNMRRVLEYVLQFTNCDGHKFKTTASINRIDKSSNNSDLLDEISFGLEIVIQDNAMLRELAIERRKEGKATTMYTATEHFPNSVTRSLPAESYWTMMFAGASKLDGFLRWAYDAWTESPLDDTTHWSFPAGDCYLVFPSPRHSVTRESLLSIRMLRLDEGVRDINKLNVLRQECEQLTFAIDRVLDSVKTGYGFDKLTDRKWGAFCREAKWANTQSAIDIPYDMLLLKSKINELAK